VIIKSKDLNGDPVDSKKIENLVLNNSVCNTIISQALNNVLKVENSEKD